MHSRKKYLTYIGFLLVIVITIVGVVLLGNNSSLFQSNVISSTDRCGNFLTLFPEGKDCSTSGEVCYVDFKTSDHFANVTWCISDLGSGSIEVNGEMCWYSDFSNRRDISCKSPYAIEDLPHLEAGRSYQWTLPVRVYNSNGSSTSKTLGTTFRTKTTQEVMEGFDEETYLLAFPEVAAEFGRGYFNNAAEHFSRYGFFEHRLERPEYVQAKKTLAFVHELENNHTVYDAYALTYPDLTAALQRGEIPSFVDHFKARGWREGRDTRENFLEVLSTLEHFDESLYRYAFPDVRKGIRDGSLLSGYDHFVRFGFKENRLARQEIQDTKDYLARFDVDFYRFAFTDLRNAFGNNIDKYRTHFYTKGFFENRLGRQEYLSVESTFKNLDSEAYVLAYPAAVGFESPSEHLRQIGYELGYHTSAALLLAKNLLAQGYVDERYRNAFPAVDEAVEEGLFTNGFEHYVKHGQAEKRLERDEYISFHDDLVITQTMKALVDRYGNYNWKQLGPDWYLVQIQNLEGAPRVYYFSQALGFGYSMPYEAYVYIAQHSDLGGIIGYPWHSDLTDTWYVAMEKTTLIWQGTTNLQVGEIQQTNISQEAQNDFAQYVENNDCIPYTHSFVNYTHTNGKTFPLAFAGCETLGVFTINENGRASDFIPTWGLERYLDDPELIGVPLDNPVRFGEFGWYQEYSEGVAYSKFSLVDSEFIPIDANTISQSVADSIEGKIADLFKNADGTYKKKVYGTRIIPFGDDQSFFSIVKEIETDQHHILFYNGNAGQAYHIGPESFKFLMGTEAFRQTGELPMVMSEPKTISKIGQIQEFGNYTLLETIGGEIVQVNSPTSEVQNVIRSAASASGYVSIGLPIQIGQYWIQFQKYSQEKSGAVVYNTRTRQAKQIPWHLYSHVFSQDGQTEGFSLDRLALHRFGAPIGEFIPIPGYIQGQEFENVLLSYAVQDSQPLVEEHDILLQNYDDVESYFDAYVITNVFGGLDPRTTSYVKHTRIIEDDAEWQLPVTLVVGGNALQKGVLIMFKANHNIVLVDALTPSEDFDVQVRRQYVIQRDHDLYNQLTDEQKQSLAAFPQTGVFEFGKIRYELAQEYAQKLQQPLVFMETVQTIWDVLNRETYGYTIDPQVLITDECNFGSENTDACTYGVAKSNRYRAYATEVDGQPMVVLVHSELDNIVKIWNDTGKMGDTVSHELGHLVDRGYDNYVWDSSFLESLTDHRRYQHQDSLNNIIEYESISGNIKEDPLLFADIIDPLCAGGACAHEGQREGNNNWLLKDLGVRGFVPTNSQAFFEVVAMQHHYKEIIRYIPSSMHLERLYQFIYFWSALSGEDLTGFFEEKGISVSDITKKRIHYILSNHITAAETIIDVDKSNPDDIGGQPATTLQKKFQDLFKGFEALVSLRDTLDLILDVADLPKTIDRIYGVDVNERRLKGQEWINVLYDVSTDLAGKQYDIRSPYWHPAGGWAIPFGYNAIMIFNPHKNKVYNMSSRINSFIGYAEIARNETLFDKLGLPISHEEVVIGEDGKSDFQKFEHGSVFVTRYSRSGTLCLDKTTCSSMYFGD